MRTTGDAGVLDERVPFLEAPPLAPDEHEAYGQPASRTETASLFEHCVRAIDKGLTAGAHGLPLIGSGDWNDGMNRVGRRGPGREHLARLLPPRRARRVRPALRRRGATLRAPSATAAKPRGSPSRSSGPGTANGTGAATTTTARRSARRRTTSAGSTRSRSPGPCSPGAVAGAFRRARHGRRPHAPRRAAARRCCCCSTPPFDRSAQDPGYIKGYPPGVRENGGQYTHAAVWVVMALARLGSGDEAAELFHMLNPVNHTRTDADVERYKAEPYVIAGDVYAHPAHAGRAGWTWYTGSAGWMYRAGLESILGLRAPRRDLRDRSLHPGLLARIRDRLAIRRDAVRDLGPQSGAALQGVATAELDGVAVDPRAIPLVDDGAIHHVRLVMGSSLQRP